MHIIDNVRTTFLSRKGLVIATAVLFVFALTMLNTRVPQTQASPAFPVWVQSGLLRVGNTDVPGPNSSIILSGARGETVDTQVIVQAPAGGLTNVNLSPSALTGPGGATILR